MKKRRAEFVNPDAEMILLCNRLVGIKANMAALDTDAEASATLASNWEDVRNSIQALRGPLSIAGVKAMTRAAMAIEPASFAAWLTKRVCQFVVSQEVGGPTRGELIEALDRAHDELLRIGGAWNLLPGERRVRLISESQRITRILADVRALPQQIAVSDEIRPSRVGTNQEFER